MYHVHECKNVADTCSLRSRVCGCSAGTGCDCKVVFKDYLQLVFVQLRSAGLAVYPRFPTGFRAEGPAPRTSLRP